MISTKDRHSSLLLEKRISSGHCFPYHHRRPCFPRERRRRRQSPSTSALFWKKFWKGKDQSGEDSNEWRSIEEEENSENQPDWQEELAQKESGSYWSSFEPSENENDANGSQSGDKLLDDDVQADAWLESMAVLANEEVEFNRKEADRADKARQMEEWGFDGEAIANSLGVATDASLETEDEVEGMQMYREEEYLDEVDLQTVESHTLVEKDLETGEPIRSQMVYVDEHECIGCTHCASVSPATFFHGGLERSSSSVQSVGR